MHIYTAQDGSPIYTVEQVRDRGVARSCHGSFTTPTNNESKKARGQADWIVRTFRTRDKLSMLTMNKSLVVPLL